MELGNATTQMPRATQAMRAPAVDIKVAILAGGLGSRIQEETEIKPKPMVEIGGKPILWHIMKIYSSQGFNDFVLALGYKGEVIKRWMVDYSSLQGDLTVSLGSGRVVPHNGNGGGNGKHTPTVDDWTVDLVDTGQGTATGGRIKRLAPYVGDSTFMLTWGDGVADIDLNRLLEFHREHGKLATVTAVRPPARFGHLEFDGDVITEFSEKPQLGEGWINGAFFVLEPGVFDYIESDRTHWEREPLERLARDRQLVGYRHDSFWQCMDTLRDKKLLEEFWSNGAPWRIWK